MKSLSVIFSVLLLVACGGKDEATSEQKAKLKEVNQSSKSAMNSGSSVRQGRNRNIAKASKDSASSRENSRLSEELENSIGKCDFPVTQSTEKVPTMSVKIEGPECPIAMDIGATLKSDNEALIRIFFEIKSEKLKELVDVTRFELEGPVTKDSMSLKGSLSSKKHGEVGLTVSASGNQDSSTAELTYDFSDFSITVKIEQNGKDLKFYINDKEATQEEALDVLGGSLGAPGMAA